MSTFARSIKYKWLRQGNKLFQVCVIHLISNSTTFYSQLEYNMGGTGGFMVKTHAPDLKSPGPVAGHIFFPYV